MYSSPGKVKNPKKIKELQDSGDGVGGVFNFCFAFDHQTVLFRLDINVLIPDS